MLARRYNRGSIIGRLLNFGSLVQLNVPEDEFGYTALYSAVLCGSNWAAAALINAGADVEARSKIGRTALFTAIEVGNSEIVAAILSRYPSLLNQPAESQTELKPLHISCLFCQRYITSLLIEAGADLNVVTADHSNHWSFTPVHLALLAGDQQSALELVSAGADVNISNSKGRRPM
jgi:ankyrin repeat protein